MALKIVTLVGFVIHFIATALYVLPINPVRLAAEPVLQATIGTFFSQNWNLFAPNPISSTVTLLVRCLDAKEAETARNASLPGSGWVDLSSPLFAHAQHNRLSAYERMVRPQENAIRAYVGNALEFQPLIDRCSKKDEDACATLKRIADARRPIAAGMLRQIGSVYCRETRTPDDTVAVALRYRERYAVPWSQRWSGTAKTTDFDLGVYPLDTNVVLSDLFLPLRQP